MCDATYVYYFQQSMCQSTLTNVKLAFSRKIIIPLIKDQKISTTSKVLFCKSKS